MKLKANLKCNYRLCYQHLMNIGAGLASIRLYRSNKYSKSTSKESFIEVRNLFLTPSVYLSRNLSLLKSFNFYVLIFATWCASCVYELVIYYSVLYNLYVYGVNEFVVNNEYWTLMYVLVQWTFMILMCRFLVYTIVQYFDTLVNNIKSKAILLEQQSKLYSVCCIVFTFVLLAFSSYFTAAFNSHSEFLGKLSLISFFVLVFIMVGLLLLTYLFEGLLAGENWIIGLYAAYRFTVEFVMSMTGLARTGSVVAGIGESIIMNGKGWLLTISLDSGRDVLLEISNKSLRSGRNGINFAGSSFIRALAPLVHERVVSGSAKITIAARDLQSSLSHLRQPYLNVDDEADEIVYDKNLFVNNVNELHAQVFSKEGMNWASIASKYMNSSVMFLERISRTARLSQNDASTKEAVNNMFSVRNTLQNRALDSTTPWLYTCRFSLSRDPLEKVNHGEQISTSTNMIAQLVFSDIDELSGRRIIYLPYWESHGYTQDPLLSLGDHVYVCEDDGGFNARKSGKLDELSGKVKTSQDKLTRAKSFKSFTAHSGVNKVPGVFEMSLVHTNFEKFTAWNHLIVQGKNFRATDASFRQDITEHQMKELEESQTKCLEKIGGRKHALEIGLKIEQTPIKELITKRAVSPTMRLNFNASDESMEQVKLLATKKKDA